MGTERLDAEIKTRVPSAVKARFENIAADRHLDVADIAREAFREFLARQIPPTLPGSATNGVPQSEPAENAA